MGWGGARPGGGKPKGYKAPHTLEAQEAKKAFVEHVTKNVSRYILKLEELAAEGRIEAIRELLERGIGKVKDVKEIEFREQAPLEDVAIQEDNSVQED